MVNVIVNIIFQKNCFLRKKSMSEKIKKVIKEFNFHVKNVGVWLAQRVEQRLDRSLFPYSRQ